MKKLLSILLVLVLAFSFVACNENNNDNGKKNDSKEVNEPVENEEPADKDDQDEEVALFPVTLTDTVGREVRLEAEPMKIISLTPSLTETVYAFGLGDRLVGRSSFCDFPAEVADVTDLGPLSDPNIEMIIALEPDVVLMSTHYSEEVVASLEEAGIPVVILLAQETFDGVYEILNLFGQVVGAPETAETIVTEMKEEVDYLTNAVKDVEKKTVYYALWFGNGDSTATGDTFIHQMLVMAGLENIAADAKDWGYNLETLLEKDPHFVILSDKYDYKTNFMTSEGYMELTAVKEDRVLELDTNLLDRQGPRLVEGLRALIELMNPEALQ